MVQLVFDAFSRGRITNEIMNDAHAHDAHGIAHVVAGISKP